MSSIYAKQQAGKIIDLFESKTDPVMLLGLSNEILRTITLIEVNALDYDLVTTWRGNYMNAAAMGSFLRPKHDPQYGRDTTRFTEELKAICNKIIQADSEF
ncbi:MAG TPA: hypothetical protein VK644_12380 [Chitinophagaceae bacterium]|nr:hypothetical protein [Chitinophagaceae bacterium]